MFLTLKGLTMLTIIAQSEQRVQASAYASEQRALIFFVADDDGERVHEVESFGGLTEMQETGGMMSACDLASNNAFQACLDYCHGLPYEVDEQVIQEQLAIHRAYVLNKMWS